MGHLNSTEDNLSLIDSNSDGRGVDLSLNY
jgi:hypothetical protein